METVLVIDDSQEVLDTVSMILDDEGYNVVLAMEPERAVALCNEIKFDAIVCDLFMFEDLSEPDSGSITTGLDVIWRLRDTHPNVPIIAMSGHVEARVLERIKKMGVAGALQKPFGREDLIQAVSNAISSSKSHQAVQQKH